MRKPTPHLLAMLFSTCFAVVASAANRYPPGPGGTCPDTLRIAALEDITAACHPAIADTVLGIGGIVIGFDAKPSAFATFLQNSQGGAFSGVEAFTGAFNYNASPFNLVEGDSVVVYGALQEFPSPNGTTEIDGPDGIQSTNDIVIRKISSGHPLPPFQTVTPHQLNWIPTSAGNEGERWENCLVSLSGPLKVGRRSTQSGNPPLPVNSFLAVSVASPGDSVLVDGNTLTTFSPPAPGASIDYIQGIVSQSTTTSVNSYRVQLRRSSDILLSVPPDLADAYPISDAIAGLNPAPRHARIAAASNERLRLVFSANVDVSTAQNVGNYSLASGIDGSTVNHATATGNIVLLDITSVRGRGALETVSASGIGSSNCPSCLMSTQSRTFYNAVLQAKEVQAPSPDSLVACLDVSRFAGPGGTPGARLAMRGVGVGKFGSLQYLEDANGAQRGGVSVFGPSAPLDIGHDFLIAGQVLEFGGETEIVNNVYLEDQGVPGAPAAAVFSAEQVSVLTNTTCDANQNITNGEDYEGMLVHIDHLMVTERSAAGQSFFAGAFVSPSTGDTIQVSNLNSTLGFYAPPDSGTIIDVTGILHFASGTFRICPRTVTDITNVAVGVEELAASTVSFSAFPNPGTSARLQFTLPRRTNVELGVYDLLGRRVAQIARGTLPAGTHSRQWRGIDDSGKRVRAGVYFYRLTVGQETFRVTGVMLQ